jgi:hypothetical protein
MPYHRHAAARRWFHDSGQSPPSYQLQRRGEGASTPTPATDTEIPLCWSGSLSVCDSISQTMQELRVWPRKIFRYAQALYLGDLRCFPGVMQCGKRSAHC